MRYFLSLLVAALLLVAAPGCTSDATGAPSEGRGEAASTPVVSASMAVGTADLPPSRAGDAEAAADYEQALSRLFTEVVTETGNVHYDLLRGRLNTDFRRVLKAVETYDASRLSSQSEKMAFWINAYNVQMLANILEAWPVKDVSAHDKYFFNRPLRTAGRAFSLDQIENAILRKKSQRLRSLQPDSLDPRLHAAVNCAAASCPRLRQDAYTPTTVDVMLDEAMRDFTGSTEHFRRNGDRFTVNAILKWYGSDFDQAGRPAGDYLLSFMPEGRSHYAAFQRLLKGRTAAQIQNQDSVSFAYDWTLNAATEEASSSGDR